MRFGFCRSYEACVRRAHRIPHISLQSWIWLSVLLLTAHAGEPTVCADSDCCKRLVGDGDDNLMLDSQISASSALNGYEPVQSRLDSQKAWAPAQAMVGQYDQYIQWDLYDKRLNILAIGTKGRAGGFWVTTYKIRYSVDGSSWESLPWVYNGNTDANTLKTNQLDPPVVARFIRLYPMSWQSWPNLRAELYGCIPEPPKERCGTPSLSASYDVSGCRKLTKCQTCAVTCVAGTFGNPTTLQCMGFADELINDTTFNSTFSNWLDYSTTTCDPSDINDPVTLIYGSRCGLQPCCPIEPVRPSGCFNHMDVAFGNAGQCDRAIAELNMTCEANFCPTCGIMAGYCDFTCGYGACAYCGDCWRESELRVGAVGRCDDGNSVSGDGCSSTCTIEPGYTCTEGSGPDGPAADICEMCVDVANWTDSQGYSCEDYRMMEACNRHAQSNDPVMPGGNMFNTPRFHVYQFVYDLKLTDAKPMILYVSVQARDNAHIFLGRPPGTPVMNLPAVGVHGFEIVIGGWNNGMSMIRKYPGKQELARAYGPRLSESEAKDFWIYCAANGTLLVGEGSTLFNNHFLGGDVGVKQKYKNQAGNDVYTSGVLTVDAQFFSWFYPVDQVSIATGWGSPGEWQLRLATGTSGQTIGELANGGMDAAQACCFCGGGTKGRKCDLEDKSVNGPAPPRFHVPSARRLDHWYDDDDDIEDRSVNGPESPPFHVPSARRLNHWYPADTKSFSGPLLILGPPSAEGFLARIAVAHTCAYDGPGWIDCYINAIVVPSEAASRVTLPLINVWSQVRSFGCRLRNYKLKRQVATRWAARGCNFQKGKDYTLFVHLEPGTAVQTVTFNIPSPPSAKPSSISFDDVDPVPGYIAGPVHLQGAHDESEILQYRVYWGRENDTKVTTLDHRHALAGIANTYSDGGFRNGFTNFCLYGDCHWKAERAMSHRRRGLYRLRHEGMGICVCQSGDTKELQQLPCPTQILSMDHPQATSHTECLWLYADVIVNKAGKEGETIDALETRIKNVKYRECLCQVPVLAQKSEDGQELPAPLGEASVEVMIGKWCQTPRFSYLIAGETAPTQGYCEWRIMSADPAPTATVNVDAESSPANSTFATYGSVSKHSHWHGAPAWHLDAVGRLDLKSKRTIGSQYTFAIWVDLHYLAQAPYQEGERALFSARSATSGEEEPCLMVQQRRRIDDRQPVCDLPACNGTKLDLCCGNETTTTTTATTTTSTTSSTTSNETDNDTTAPELPEFPASTEDVCGCLCPKGNDTSAVGEDLSGNQWALGLKACGSQLMWDSGFDLVLPKGKEHGWLLIAAVGDAESGDDGETVFYASKPKEPFSVERTSEFGCAKPGCSTTAVIRDIPRDATRACALNVRVRITDYGDGLQHPNPELVESIMVSGGSPERTLLVREDCHPDGENDHERLFTCVERFDLDAMVGVSTATRAIRVRIKVSEAVDEHPLPNGDILSGVASVVCNKVVAVDHHAPPSGGLQRVGISKHTCAGSLLEAIGGSATATSNNLDAYIGQAWYFDRKVPEDELIALFHATRTRYYQDYELILESVGVISSALEARVIERLRCRRPGCEAKATLEGLPTAQTSTCLLTVGVTPTDFSSDREKIEYIRLDGIEVVTDCQVGSDSGDIKVEHPDEQWGFLCAEDLDVSQHVLKSLYMNDGKVEVTAKITDEVDKYRTWERDLLDAKVQIHCVGGRMEEHKRSWESVRVSPVTEHLLVVAANINGESAPVGGSLTDRVNGFTRMPKLSGPVTSRAAMFEFSVTDPEGVIYVYATRKEDRHLVTKRGIIDGLSDLDICPGPGNPMSHRRRGSQLLRYWGTGEVLTDVISTCQFESQVPYTVFIYVDTSDPNIPQGGGSLAELDIVGPVPTIRPSPGEQWRPILRPQKVEFIDQDVTVRVIQGQVTITRAYSEVGITNYYMYFGRGSQHLPVMDPVRLADIPATGADTYSVYIHQTIPSGASHLIVFSVNVRPDYPYPSRVCRDFTILDNSISFIEPPTLGQAPGNEELDRFRVGVKLSTANVRVDIALVRKGGEVNARPEENQRALRFKEMEKDTVCIAENRMSDLSTDHFDFGPCRVVPNVDYVVVVFASIRIECPCRPPCRCSGVMTHNVQASSGSRLIHTAFHGFQQPDVLAPGASLECDSCGTDRVLRPILDAHDPGTSYPILATCFACLKTTPAMCVRAGDSEEHRYWRLRFTGWTWCQQIDIKTLEFHDLSVLSPDGVNVSGTAIAGATEVLKEPESPKQNAFDDSEATSYAMGPVMMGCYRDVPSDRDLDIYAGVGTWKECAEMCKDYTYFGRQGLRQCWCGSLYGKHGPQNLNFPCNCEPDAVDIGTDRNCIYDRTKSYAASAWLGLDLGPDRKAAISRARIKWVTNGNALCAHSWNEKAVLEYSDDAMHWHLKLNQQIEFSNYESKMFPNPKVRDSDFNGTYYQTIFPGEGKNIVPISGLTPMTTYTVQCYMEDAAGNSGWATEADMTTTDKTGPVLTISGFASVTDFTVEPQLHIIEPGNSYPVLLKCFAREHRPGTPPPTMEMLSGKGQKCRKIHAPAASTNEGRVKYILVLSSWLTGQDTKIVYGQTVFGTTGKDYREEVKSCGHRHQPANGVGGCATQTTGVKQAARFHLVVKAYRDAYIFIGGGERGAVGYEIVLGGWSNKKNAIKKGHSADVVNQDLKFGSIVAYYASGDGVLGPDRVRHFWISADPNTGLIVVGTGEIWGHNVIMSYKDDDVLDGLDHVWVAGGHYSGGGPGFYGIDYMVCPPIGNLALHRPSSSQSVSFGGTPDKAFDGQTGGGIFCEYCAQADPRHVCAQTRKGTSFIPPWVKVDLGKDLQIGSVRVVGPQPGEVLPAQTTVSIYVGTQGSRSDRLCVHYVDIVGDNVFVCDDPQGITGRYVSLYGHIELLRPLPDVQGIRVCEIEVYQHFIENDEIHRAYKLYERTTGLPTPIAPPVSTFTIGALEPNMDYEVFCYGEDEFGSGSLSNPMYASTTDNTPPSLKILDLVAGDYDITIKVELSDPGKSYPAVTRCIASKDGVLPQGQDRYFEHRYWRMVFAAPPNTLAEKCEGSISVRAASLLGYGSSKLRGLALSSVGAVRGTAENTDDFVTDPYYYDKDSDVVAWQLPDGQPWLGFDLEGRPEYENRLREKGVSTEGDLVISAAWNASGNDTAHLKLFVITPDGDRFHRDDPRTKHGLMDLTMQCQDMREPLRMKYLGRKVNCQGSQLPIPGEQLSHPGNLEEGWAGANEIEASIEECKARCMANEKCTGFKRSHAFPDAGKCTFFHGTIVTTPQSVAYMNYMCYKKDGVLSISYERVYTTQMCTDAPLHDLGGAFGNTPEGVLASREACQAVCTGSEECQYYLWKDNPDGTTRYHCEFWATCTSVVAYSSQGFGDTGSIAHIYKKHNRTTLAERPYSRTGPNHYCIEGEDITTENECLEAATLFIPGLLTKETPLNTFYGAGEHRYCYIKISSGIMNAFFNEALGAGAQNINERSGTGTAFHISLCKSVELPPIDCCMPALSLVPPPKIENQIDYILVSTGICEDQDTHTITDDAECLHAIRWLRQEPHLERPYPEGGRTYSGAKNEHLPKGCNILGSDVTDAAYYPTGQAECGQDNYQCICKRYHRKTCKKSEFIESAIFAFTHPGTYEAYVQKTEPLPKEPAEIRLVMEDAWCASPGALGGDLSQRTLESCKEFCLKHTDCTGFSYFQAPGQTWYDCDVFTSPMTVRAVRPGETSRKCYEKVQEDPVVDFGTAFVKICGQTFEIPLNLTEDEENITIGEFTVPSRGCTRSPRDPTLQSWQISSVAEGDHFGAPLRSAFYGIDGDNNTCAETGGAGRKPQVVDDRAWWRTDLGRLLHVESLWIAADLLTGDGAGARFVDIFVIESFVTELDELYLYPMFGAGRICDRDLGAERLVDPPLYRLTLKQCQAKCNRHPDCHYVSYQYTGGERVGWCDLYKTCAVPKTASGYDTYVREGAKDKLCATSVRIGSALEHEYAPPMTVVNCAPGLIGSHVWIFSADGQRGLTLCEVEIYTKPLFVASEARWQWGTAPNSTEEICGAQNVTIEWSDDAVDWHNVWDAQATPQAYPVQTGTWSWWSQLFELNFTATFYTEGVQNVVLPSLRPNTTYDVFCWAIDALGNDISRELVTLLKPWGDTRDTDTTDIGYQGVEGARRLSGRVAELGFSGGLQCTESLRELIPCEERIQTMDHKPPVVVSFTLARREQGARDQSGADTERAVVEISLSDTSCEKRQIRGVKCLARCQIRELIDAPAEWHIKVCSMPTCFEKRWSNEQKVQFVFAPLYGGVSYALMCNFTDPWNNSHRERFELHLPTTATTTLASAATTQAMQAVPTSAARPSPVARQEETKEQEERMRQSTTLARWMRNWVPPTPSPSTDEEEVQQANTMQELTDRGWIVIEEQYTFRTTVRTTSQTTLPLFTTSWLLEEETTPTTTEQTTTLPGASGTPPPPVHFLLSLATSSDAQAQLLLRPSAISALVSALRQALGLSADDTVVVQAAKVFAPPGRRLNESGHQVWEVRLRLKLQLVGQLHAEEVNEKLVEVRDGTGERRQLLTQSFEKELAARSVAVSEIAVVGARLQDTDIVAIEQSSGKNGKTTAGDVMPEGDGAAAHGGGDIVTSEESSDAMMWVVIASVTVGLLLFLVPACVVCAWWYGHGQRQRKDDVKHWTSPVRSSTNELRTAAIAAAARRRESGRRDAGEQTGQPTAVQKLPVQPPTPTQGPVSPCKIAWASADEERAGTPDSLSTASTRHPGAQHVSSSNASAVPSTRTGTPGSEPGSIVGELPATRTASQSSFLDDGVEVESCSSVNVYATSAPDSTTLPGPAAQPVAQAPVSARSVTARPGPAPAALPVATTPASATALRASANMDAVASGSVAHSRSTSMAPGTAALARAMRDHAATSAMPPGAGAVARAMRDNAAAAAAGSSISALRYAQPAPAPPDTLGVPVGYRPHARNRGVSDTSHAHAHLRGNAATHSPLDRSDRSVRSRSLGTGQRGVPRSSSGTRRHPPLLS